MGEHGGVCQDGRGQGTDGVVSERDGDKRIGERIATYGCALILYDAIKDSSTIKVWDISVFMIGGIHYGKQRYHLRVHPSIHRLAEGR